jgi:hypothetical protein
MTTNNRTRDSNERFYAPAPIGLFKRLAIAVAVLGSSMLMFRSVSDGANGPTLDRRGSDQDRRRRKG